jgi:hypothetical protein
MTLIDNCADIPSGGNPDEVRANAACNLGAVVWRRDSFFLGSGPASYYVIQVVDGDGKEIDDVWDWFVEYQNEEVSDQNPGRANRNTFGSLSGDAGSKKSSKVSVDPGFCQCAYTGDHPFGLDNLEPWEPILVPASSKGKRDRALRKHIGNGNRKHRTSKVKGERLLQQQHGRDLNSCPSPSPT